jgi:hypothetical protein
MISNIINRQEKREATKAAAGQSKIKPTYIIIGANWQATATSITAFSYNSTLHIILSTNVKCDP